MLSDILPCEACRPAPFAQYHARNLLIDLLWQPIEYLQILVLRPSKSAFMPMVDIIDVARLQIDYKEYKYNADE